MAVSQKNAVVMMVIAAVLWSISGVFIKLIPWHALVISGWRSFFSMLVFVCYFIWKKYPLVVNRRTVACGAILCVTLLLYIAACKLTTSANAIILQSTSPIFIMILGTMFFGDRYRKVEYVLVLVVMGGTGLFFLDQLTPGGMVGNILALISGISLGGMFLLSSRLPDDASSQSSLLIGHALTAIVGIPMMFVFPTPITAPAVASIVILGVVQLGIPYVLYGIAVRVCTPITCSLIGMLEPLLNPVWVLIFVGEMPGIFAVLGGAVVLGSVCAWMMMNAALSRRETADTADEEGTRQES